MASDRENFNRNGPLYLTAVDWSNPHHRRSIAASLVQGVYTMERDRKQTRQGPYALAPPWWQSFNFKVHQILTDDHSGSYFGTIYEFNFPHNDFHQRPPQYVIAFQGTIKEPGNRKQDFKLNLHCIVNDLRDSTRFQIGLEKTREFAYRAGPGNVWLVGHSLGSSIALLVGRHMIKYEGMHLETYLFNPPFVSPPIEWIKSEKVKLVLRLPNSLFTAGLAYAVNGGQSTEDPFVVLSNWRPYLFLNPSDPICSVYAGYFKHREKMESIGAGKIGSLDAKHSIGSIVSGVIGKDCEAAHLIPCAHVITNMTPSRSLKEAHGLDQWWRQNLEFNYNLYQYKS